ncbi:probable chitinase 10 [Ochlerotatus camptorhynchus]|uniref:probable chitinase 10 n=1 Tax=Ochlerotatus camptorhynchus TaxID=644619 RepID=UPI0031D42680
MKVQVILLALVACIATHSVAEPSCPPLGDTETVVYFPHPTDCSKFLTCHWGNLVELCCPSGTFWNDDIRACDLQGNVICTPQPEPTTAELTTAEPTTAEPTTAEPTTAEPTTAEPTTAGPVTTTTELDTTTSTMAAPPTHPSEQCPDSYDPNNEVFVPHADCTKYYICTWGGVAVEQKCPPNLHWNQNLSYCDYPAQAGCSSASPTPQPTSEPVTSTTSAPTSASPPAPSGDCPPVYDPSHQVYFPHADCSKYYICTYEGSKLEQNCPAGLHWSQNVSYCDYPAQAGCSSASPTSKPTSEPVTSTTSAPTSASPPAPSGDCPPVYDPNHQVYFPHADCTKYYICTYEGNKLEQNCPAGLHWSQAQSYCDRPELAQCTQLK